MAKKTFWILLVILSIIIGLYPSLYFFLDRKFGLLHSKNNELLSNLSWNIGFYIHIIFGGLALLIGWTQFNSKIRTKKLNIHRQTGRIYVISALLSALTSLYIAVYATGGIISSLGFMCLGMIWFYTTLKAYRYIRKAEIENHKKMMIYSYACCFAAVTLRIWLPILMLLFNDFIISYRIVAWLCWIPNLILAYAMVNRTETINNIKK